LLYSSRASRSRQPKVVVERSDIITVKQAHALKKRRVNEGAKMVHLWWSWCECNFGQGQRGMENITILVNNEGNNVINETFLEL